jgi:hypothetical protein
VSLPGVEIPTPFFAEPLRMTRIVPDYTGTLSFHGRLIPGVQDRLSKLQALVTIDVLTAVIGHSKGATRWNAFLGCADI